MKVYQVGGAVRDDLLGRAVSDRDYVVTGTTPEHMAALGFQPVGRDFPVFLHPETHEEYALARTERKSGRGYRGFTVHASPGVSLEEDLARRDLTINAMARGEDGVLVDPFGGARDLAEGVLRHVSPAFVEDPVRILRVARFAARFGFRVAEETVALMRHMVDSGEADHLVPERVWQEVSRGLMEDRPSILFETLAHCGALARVLPEWAAAVDPRRDAARETLARLDAAAGQGEPLSVRFALAAHRVGPALEALDARLRTPASCSGLAALCARHLTTVRSAASLPADAITDLLYRVDAFRRPERFAELMRVAAIEDGRYVGDHPPARRLAQALSAALAVDAGAIARAHPGAEAGARIRSARVAAVAVVQATPASG